MNKILALIILLVVAAGLIALFHFNGYQNEKFCWFSRDCGGLQCTIKSSIVAVAILILVLVLL